MRNWVSFHYSAQKSEKLYINGLFLSKGYMFQLESFRGITCHYTEGNATFKGKPTCGLGNDIRNLANFRASREKVENLHFARILLPKAYKDLDEKIRKIYVS